MKQPWRSFDPGFLVVLLISLLAVWPLLSRASLPEGTDAELHIFRLHELGTLVRGGEFYPRWAPNFYHGYGYPIFNYYAPLTYYLALPLELLPQFDATAASKAVLVGGMLLAGLGLYGFVRDNWGRRAGYVAAALYVYAPYLHYVDPHIRGALPEAFSFAAFPLALWALDRLRQRPSAGSWLASVGLVAAVILSHNLMGLFFFGLLFAWAVWQWLAVERGSSIPLPSGGARGGRVTGAVAEDPLPNPLPRGEGTAPLLASALVLGLGAAAFFWLPVILERDAVNLTTLIGANDNYDFHTHFIGLGELLAFSRRPDWGATQSPFLFNLGVAQWLGGLLGVVMLALGRARHHRQALFFALAAAAVLFLISPLSEPIWEAVPFLPYFQFPWRLLGAAGALLAVLGAVGIEAVASGGWWVANASAESASSDADDLGEGRASEGAPSAVTRPATRHAPLATRHPYLIALAVPMLLALPLSQPAPWAPFGEVNTLRMSQIENSGRWLGTTSTADYVPATVEMLPPRRPQMVDPLALGLPPDRVNHEAMPDGAIVVAETVRPLFTRYHVTAPKPFRLRLYQFDFPGWRVTIDGEPTVTELAEPEGTIVILVPQGEHVVEVTFGSTPARTLAWAISAAGLLVALAIAWRLRRPAPRLAALDHANLRADWPFLALAGAITLGAILLEPLGLFHNHSQAGLLDVPAVAVGANFGDQIALLGYHVDSESAAPGDTLELTLFWQAQRPLDIEYQVFVHVMDTSGQLVAQSDKINPGEFPTHRWPIDRYVPDTHRLALPPDLPPGQYTVATGLWVQAEGWRLPVFNDDGAAVGDTKLLFTLEVE